MDPRMLEGEVELTISRNIRLTFGAALPAGVLGVVLGALTGILAGALTSGVRRPFAGVTRLFVGEGAGFSPAVATLLGLALLLGLGVTFALVLAAIVRPRAGLAGTAAAGAALGLLLFAAAKVWVLPSIRGEAMGPVNAAALLIALVVYGVVAGVVIARYRAARREWFSPRPLRPAPARPGRARAASGGSWSGPFRRRARPG